MPTREVWIVESREEDGWAVQCEGAEHADSLHMAKDIAVSRGVDLAKAAGGDLRIKGKDGRVEDTRTYGVDDTVPNV
jgi:hypothetical protein